MRIIAGKHKGRKFPELKASGVRPTLDRVRENFFNIISQKVQNSTFLDLFSGSGAMGIEALSRGAKQVVFCDKSREIVSYISKIGDMLGEKFEIYCSDYRSVLKRLQDSFDIIYLDPPYEMDGNEVLNELYSSTVCGQDSIVVYERSSEKSFELKSNFEIIDERKYGIAVLTFLRKKNG